MELFFWKIGAKGGDIVSLTEENKYPIILAIESGGVIFTMVISTSTDFTSGAYSLAKANNTELISGQRLSEMLMQYLGESWG